MGLGETGKGEEAALCTCIERMAGWRTGLRRDERGRYGRPHQVTMARIVGAQVKALWPFDLS